LLTSLEGVPARINKKGKHSSNNYFTKKR